MPPGYGTPDEALGEQVQCMYDAGYKLESVGGFRINLVGTGLDAKWEAEITMTSPRLGCTYTGRGVRPVRQEGKLARSLAIHDAQGMAFRTHVARYMRVTGDELLPKSHRCDDTRTRNRGCDIVSGTPPTTTTTTTTTPQPEVCDMCGHSSHYYDGKSGRAYVLSVEGRVYQIANGKRDYVEREVRRLFSSQEPDADRDVDAMILEMPVHRFNPNAKDGDSLTCWVDDGGLTYVDLAQDLSIHISMQSVHVGPAGAQGRCV